MLVYAFNGSEAGSLLRAHTFSDCEREGVMVTPVSSQRFLNVHARMLFVKLTSVSYA